MSAEKVKILKIAHLSLDSEDDCDANQRNGAEKVVEGLQ